MVGASVEKKLKDSIDRKVKVRPPCGTTIHAFPKNGQLVAYNDVVKDYIQRGVFKELSQKKMTTLAPEYKGSMWVTRGRSHPGLADRSPKPTEPPEKLSLQSRTFLEEEEEVAVPRAGISCPAGPGPNPKVRGLYHLEPTLTDDDQLHKKLRPEAEPGGPYDVSTSAPASTSTNASVHAFADDPDVTNDRRERPQPGSAKGPG